MPKRAKFINEKVQELSKVVPMLAKGSRIIVNKRVQSSLIEETVTNTLEEYPSDAMLLYDLAIVQGNGWVLEVRGAEQFVAIWNNRVGLRLAGYSIKFFQPAKDE